MNEPFRVVAIIAAFNEGDIISSVIGHLVENGIDVYLIDNHSTDDTVEESRRWLGRGLLKIESFPQKSTSVGEAPGLFDWTAILRRKEELAQQLRADWFIHHDADEIREGPLPGFNLKEAIRWVDSLNYNCIDFRVYNFSPTDEGFRQGDDPCVYFQFYEEPAEFDKIQVKCWKRGETPVSLVPSGGHDVVFEGRRIFPIPFLLRHYPIRGQAHGIKKVFLERKPRLLEREHSQGWHIQYDRALNDRHNFLKNPAKLRRFDLERARLELILRDLGERFARMDVELTNLRAQQCRNQEGLEEYKRHTSNLEQARIELFQKIHSLEQEREELKAHVPDLERRLEIYRQHVEQLETLHESLQQGIGERDRELTAIRGSRSWRWTAPLRYLFDIPGRMNPRKLLDR
jgi:glycosyltransferase involved in cell wall biosynthesis